MDSDYDSLRSPSGSHIGRSASSGRLNKPTTTARIAKRLRKLWRERNFCLCFPCSDKAIIYLSLAFFVLIHVSVFLIYSIETRTVYAAATDLKYIKSAAHAKLQLVTPVSLTDVTASPHLLENEESIALLPHKDITQTFRITDRCAVVRGSPAEAYHGAIAGADTVFLVHDAGHATANFRGQKQTLVWTSVSGAASLTEFVDRTDGVLVHLATTGSKILHGGAPDSFYRRLYLIPAPAFDGFVKRVSAHATPSSLDYAIIVACYLCRSVDVYGVAQTEVQFLESYSLQLKFIV